MSYTSDGEFVADWFTTNNPPEGYGNKLFYFEHGCEYGTYDSLDDSRWYRIKCSYWFGDWIEESGGKERWQAYGARHRAIYIVREDLMMFIKLKWL